MKRIDQMRRLEKSELKRVYGAGNQGKHYGEGTEHHSDYHAPDHGNHGQGNGGGLTTTAHSTAHT